MWRVVRSVLLWVLAVALPLQGAVAATMLVCVPNHHGARTVASQPASHAHHEGATQHDHDHGDGTHALSADTAAATDVTGAAGASEAGPEAQAHQTAASKCSVCASCCTVAALPSPVILIDPPLATDSPYPSFASDAGVFMTDGPERPPRPFLA